MMWLVLSLAMICLILMLGNRSKKSVMEQSYNQQNVSIPAVIVDLEMDDEYVIAVITAAIHEFTGTDNFQVVRIKSRADNWILIGRQNLLAN